MAKKSRHHGKADKKRVFFRSNRSRPARQKQWVVPDEHNELAEDHVTSETVRAKGDLSRKRTVIERDDSSGTDAGRLAQGKVVAVRGQFVEVDDGQRVWPCAVRRILRTLLIDERSPVIVGDDVDFSIIADSEGKLNEGVIERVHERRTVLRRSDGRRTHTIAANIDQAVIIASAREPMLKPHLIDRYLVAAHAGGLDAIICVSKTDLDDSGAVREVIDRYIAIGYAALGVSSVTGEGVDALRDLMRGRTTLLAGQSGVGKSTLLNSIQPGLNLKTGHVSETTEKGRHTTTTAVWLTLEFGGAAVDTPGIRALDVAMVPLNELEMHFVEFVDRLQHCKYPSCVHLHEDGCAIIKAVENGEIDPSRYESYATLFTERAG